MAQRLERRPQDRKVEGSSPGSSGRRIVFSMVNFLRYFGIRSTPVLPQLPCYFMPKVQVAGYN